MYTLQGVSDYLTPKFSPNVAVIDKGTLGGSGISSSSLAYQISTMVIMYCWTKCIISLD